MQAMVRKKYLREIQGEIVGLSIIRFSIKNPPQLVEADVII